MKKLTLEIIRSYKPCYDPIKYIDDKWKGSILDLLDLKEVPFQDRLWVILRTELVSEKLMRLFAVCCARQVQHLMKDQRSLDALDFMDAYCEYRFLINEPDWIEAWELDRAAARDTARDAAWDAASDTARDAVWAARDAVWAARDAAWAAASDTASDTARDAAWAAASDAQETKLRQLITEGIKTGDTF